MPITALFRRSLVMVACLAGLAACATDQQVVASKEDNLAAAGFEARPANTPARQAMLRKLPPYRFVQHPHGATMTYVFADPLVCNCLYVGDQQNFAAYQRYLQQQRLASEQLVQAQYFEDPYWDWGGWGSGFAWGPGF